MRNILTHPNLKILQQFAWSKVLLAFDYDGTLSPIVGKPEQARMRRTTHRLLVDLVKLYPCILISGRAQSDAKKMVDGIAFKEIVGNHGLEPWSVSDRLSDEVHRWQPLLKELLSDMPGVKIENKNFSLAIHYRQSREKKKVRDTIRKAAEILGRMRLIRGKQVMNLLPIGAPHKGIALLKERTRLGCDTAIYIGDDETDEDVFSLDQPGNLLSIRVGKKRTSSASFYLKNQREMDAFIQYLIRLRQALK